eukprot:5246534-Amphidinium_carterae.2
MAMHVWWRLNALDNCGAAMMSGAMASARRNAVFLMRSSFSVDLPEPWSGVVLLRRAGISFSAWMAWCILRVDLEGCDAEVVNHELLVDEDGWCCAVVGVVGVDADSPLCYFDEVERYVFDDLVDAGVGWMCDFEVSEAGSMSCAVTHDESGE